MNTTSPKLKDPAYMRAARARYLARHKENAAAHRCLCGNVAARMKTGGWVCARCDELEKTNDYTFHQQAWEMKPIDGASALQDRRRRTIGPFDPAFYGRKWVCV